MMPGDIQLALDVINACVGQDELDVVLDEENEEELSILIAANTEETWFTTASTVRYETLRSAPGSYKRNLIRHLINVVKQARAEFHSQSLVFTFQE